jgi:hypothetical protein
LGVASPTVKTPRWRARFGGTPKAGRNLEQVGADGDGRTGKRIGDTLKARGGASLRVVTPGCRPRRKGHERSPGNRARCARWNLEGVKTEEGSGVEQG